jgi:hypothetical protein
MLWKQLNPSYRRLMHRGLQGEAVIVTVTADRRKGQIGGIYGWNVTVRVKFADGSSADFERYVEAGVLEDASGRSVLQLAPGMTVPIRFDPKNRLRVEIDTTVLASGQAAQRAARSAEARAQQDSDVQQAEQNLKPIESPAPPPPA